MTWKSVSVTRPVLSLPCHLCQHSLGYFNTQEQSSVLQSQVIVLTFPLFVGIQQTHGKWTLHLNNLIYFFVVFLEVWHMIIYQRCGSLSLFMICLYDVVKPLENLVNKIISLIFIGVYKYHQLYFLFNFHCTDCINIIKICTRHVLNVATFRRCQ